MLLRACETRSQCVSLAAPQAPLTVTVLQFADMQITDPQITVSGTEHNVILRTLFQNPKKQIILILKLKSKLKNHKNFIC